MFLVSRIVVTVRSAWCSFFIIIIQHFITNLHTREKSDHKSSGGNCKKKLQKWQDYHYKINYQRKKDRKKRNATRLDRGSISCKRKTCKAIQTRLSRVYGRVPPKESFNSVRMPFRKVHSLGRDWLAVSCTRILWIDLTYLTYPYNVRVSSLVLQSQM